MEREERRKICIHGSLSFRVDETSRMFETKEQLCEWMNTIMTAAPLFRSYDHTSYVDVFVNAYSDWTCTAPACYSCLGCPYDTAKLENGYYNYVCLLGTKDKRALTEHCPRYTTEVCYQRGAITFNGYVRYSTVKAVKQQLTRNVAFLRDAGIRVYNICIKIS